MSDVAIIGVGFAGTLLAHNLHRQGVSVSLFDKSPKYPDVLRAEKIEPNQADALRNLHAFEHRMPPVPSLGITVNFRNGNREKFNTVEQYTISYHDTVNSMRREMLGGVPFQIDEVIGIRNGPETQEIQTRSGNLHEARLVVVATGGNEKLIRLLGLRRKVVHSLKSLTLGFDVISQKESGFDFTGFNYFLDRNAVGIDYVTLFRIGDRMRVNVFTQWEPRSPFLKHMSKYTKAALIEHFPDIEAQIGSFEIAGKVQFFKTEFYRLRKPIVPGLIVIGDEYQSVCPATGTGLTKLATDVDVLVNDAIPRWLASPGMGQAKIAEFYRSRRKIAVDEDSLQRWRYYRDRLSPPWKVQWYRLEHRLWSALR